MGGGGGGSETRTADGLLVVSRLPGRHWPLLVLGAVMGGVPLARLIDGPGGLAPPAGASFVMAMSGALVLTYWLILRTVDEVLRKGLAAQADAPDGAVVWLRPTWTTRRGTQPAFGAFLHDASGPVGWLPMLRLHPAFDPRAPFAVAGHLVEKKASVLRARAVGQAVVGVVTPPGDTPPAPHPLAARAEELLGWSVPAPTTLGGAEGFEPVAAGRPIGPTDPGLVRAAAAALGRRRAYLRTTAVVAVVGVVVMMGNGAGDAGMAVAAGFMVGAFAATAGNRWVGRPLVDHLVAGGASVADARTLSQMLLAAGLGEDPDASSAGDVSGARRS